MKPNHLVRCVSLLVLASVALTAQVATTGECVVPLKNWATPLYWQPNQTERRRRRKRGAAAHVFVEPGVHQRSHVHRDHALPLNRYSRRGGEL